MIFFLFLFSINSREPQPPTKKKAVLYKPRKSHFYLIKSYNVLQVYADIAAERRWIAFEELLAAIEKIGDLGRGMDWAKDARNWLRAGMPYLMGDYKICIKHRGRLISLIIYVRSYDYDSKSPHK